MKNSTTKPTKELAKINQPEDNTPASLIARAIDAKITPEALEKLLTLQERWERNEAKKAYDSSMAAFQAECPTINKGKPVLNKDGTERYRFATIDSIIEQVKPLLQKHGFSYAVDVKYENKVMISICKITHIQGHSETSSFPSPIDPDAYMNEAQKFASASTFAKRYAFLNAFGIMTGDEDDDSAATGSDEKQPAKSITTGSGARSEKSLKVKNYSCAKCDNEKDWYPRTGKRKDGSTWRGLKCAKCGHMSFLPDEVPQEVEDREKGVSGLMDNIREENEKDNNDIPVIDINEITGG